MRGLSEVHVILVVKIVCVFRENLCCKKKDKTTFCCNFVLFYHGWKYIISKNLIL